MLIYANNLNTWEAEACIISSRLSWIVQWDCIYLKNEIKLKIIDHMKF